MAFPSLIANWRYRISPSEISKKQSEISRVPVLLQCNRSMNLTLKLLAQNCVEQ